MNVAYVTRAVRARHANHALMHNAIDISISNSVSSVTWCPSGPAGDGQLNNRTLGPTLSDVIRVKKRCHKWAASYRRWCACTWCAPLEEWRSSKRAWKWVGSRTWRSAARQSRTEKTSSSGNRPGTALGTRTCSNKRIINIIQCYASVCILGGFIFPTCLEIETGHLDCGSFIFN